MEGWESGEYPVVRAVQQGTNDVRRRATAVATAAVVGRDPHPIPTASPTSITTIDCVATNVMDDVLLCHWFVAN
jgi:hypothetical protein